ncbi:hypothetical protein Plhal304r1_c055g0140001 [Plasmopara halstedii]
MSDRELLSAELNFHDARAEKVTFCALESMNLGRTEKCNGFRSQKTVVLFEARVSKSSRFTQRYLRFEVTSQYRV